MSPDRRAAIVRLLESRDDHLPGLTARPLSALGFVHRAVVRESCLDCLANGFASAECETCGGRGWVEERRIRDPYDTGQSSGWFGESSVRHSAVAERDREIDRLEGQTAAPRSEADLLAETGPERWELDRGRAWRKFDYAALDLALDALRLVDEVAYHALHSGFVYAWKAEVEPGVSEAVAIDRGLAFLDERLPERLRVPAASRPVELHPPGGPRDATIRRLIGEGAATQWVAQQFGLSVSQVNRIVARKRAAA